MGPQKQTVEPQDLYTRHEPVVLQTEMEYLPLREPCVCPCCCFALCSVTGACGVGPCGIYHPCSPCMTQKAKVMRFYEYYFDFMAKIGLVAEEGPLLMFQYEHTEKGYIVTEIFRNIDAAKKYADTVQSYPGSFIFPAIPNVLPLPFMRQKELWQKIWGNRDAIKEWKGFSAGTGFHPDLEMAPGGEPSKGKWPFTQWDTPPTIEELEQQFGKLHFGFSDRQPKVQARVDNLTPPAQKMMASPR